MAALTQDVVIQLVLRYIGGSKLLPSKKLDILGQKVAVQASSLQGIADQLSKYGATADEVKAAVLKNPKVASILAAKANIDAIRTKIAAL